MTAQHRIGIGTMVGVLSVASQPAETVAALARSDLEVSLKMTTARVDNLFTYNTDTGESGGGTGEASGTGNWTTSGPTSTSADDTITFRAGFALPGAMATSDPPYGTALAIAGGRSMAFRLFNFSGSGGNSPPAQDFDVEFEVTWSYCMRAEAGANETATALFDFRIYNETTNWAEFQRFDHLYAESDSMTLEGSNPDPPPRITVTLPPNSVTKIRIDGGVTAEVTTVPEPATLGLLMLAGLVVAGRWRTRRGRRG